MEIEKWRSKPVHLKAVKVTESNIEEVAEWMGTKGTYSIIKKFGEPTQFDFKMLRIASVGDYIINYEDGVFEVRSADDLKKHYKRR